MKEDKLGDAYAEVLEVIKNSGNDIVEKIPDKIINALEHKKNPNYEVKIDFDKDNWDDYIKEDTQVILALIYRDYIVSKDEREKLITEEKENQIKIEKELKEKYSINKMFESKKPVIENTEIDEEDAMKKENSEESNKLINLEEITWYRKIYYKVIDFLKKLVKM